LISKFLDQSEFSGKVGLADLIELLTLSFPQTLFTSNRLHSVLGELWGLEDHHYELAKQEMSRRSRIAGSNYPFRLVNGVPTLGEDTGHYVALLCLSQMNKTNPDLDPTNQVVMAKDFELLVEGMLSDFFGSQTKSVNFGFPSTIGRPAEFSHAITWLASRIGIQPGTSFRSPRRKDGGVDIIIWKSFGDSRSGVPILLVQATLQKDVRSKSRDVDRRMWSGWLAMDIDPLVGLAFPHALEQSEVWNEITRNCLVLDRVRLCASSKTNDLPVPSSLQQLVQVTKSQIASAFGEYIS
jgi:hypothetical protein